MPVARTDLDRQLVDEIVGLTRQSGMRLRRRLTETGLPMGPSFCLMALSKSGEMPATRLAHEVGVRGPTLTGLLDTLEGEGLVRRKPGREDRRVTLLSVTAKGRRLLEKLQEGLLGEWREILAEVPAARKRAWIAAVRELRALAQDGMELGGPA